MLGTRTILRTLCFCAAFLAASCAAPEAYVHKPAEFNREATDFGKDPENLAEVTICYNKFATKPEIITQLAVDACGKFGKEAVFREQTLNQCPLITPMAAVYNCQGREPGNKFSRPFNGKQNYGNAYYPNLGPVAPERKK